MSERNSRLKLLQTYKILDTPPEKEFDDITQLAAQICGVPIALINFLGEDRQFFKSHHGTEVSATPIVDSFCLHTINKPKQVFVVDDVRKDERFKRNPLVNKNPKIAFYAGIALEVPDGHALGTLCVMDREPGKLNETQSRSLQALAHQVVQLLELRKARNESQNSNLNLKREAQRLESIIEASQVGTWEWNVQTGDLHINDRWAEIIGYTKEELAPLNIDMWYTVVHPDDRERTDRELQSCFDKEVAFFDTQCRMLHKDGHEVWINDRGRVVSWTEDGKPVWMLGTHTDITQQKNAEMQRDAYMNALEERIKERTVLYDIAQLSHAAISFHKLLQKVVKVIPSGFQYSTITSAQICYGKITFKSDGFKKTKWSQSVHRYAESGDKLEVTITYSKKMPEADRGPFLDEEWDLLNNIADNLIITLNYRAAVEHNELILQSTSEGIYGINEKSECTFINNSAAKILGYTLEECLGRNMHNLIHHHTEAGDHYPEKDCPVYKSRNDTKGCRINNEVFWTKENKAIPVRYSSTPILVDGKFKGAVIVFNDISETKKAEKETQIRERRYRALVENGADAIAILGLDGSVSYVSPSLKRVLGYSESEALNLNLLDIIHPEDQAEVMAKMQDVLENPENPVLGHAVRAKHHNGAWRWIEATLTNLLHDPAINGIVDNFRDVTERVESEQSLKASEEKYRSLFDTSPLPMWIYDIETGAISDVNHTAIEKYGYSREEFLNLHIQDLRPAAEIPVLNEAIKDVNHQEGTRRFGVFTHRKSNGELIRVDVSGHRLQFDNRDSLLVVANDVTEREAAFEALQVSEARYRGFYESQTNYIIRTDMGGNYSYINKKFEDDFGWIYPDGKLIGTNCLVSILEYDHHKVFEVVEKCVQSPNKVQQVEIDKPTKSGGTITTLWEFVCLLNDRGEPSEIQCVGMDVTDRINTERALKKSHERYELVNRATNDAIYDWDVKNDHFVWGDGFYRIFNYAPKEFETFRIADWNRLTHPLDSEMQRQDWDMFMTDDNQQKWVSSFRFQRANGTYAYVEEIGYMIRDENGQPERMIGVLRDQTQVKLAEIQQEIMRDVSQRFKETSSLSETLNEVLSYLTRVGKFKVAEVWLKSDYDNHLNRVEQFAKTKSGQLFFSESIACEKLKKGEDLPGAVWKKNDVIVWKDFQSKKAFIRREAAAKAGLITLVGVPLSHNQQVVGVLVLGSGESNCETETNVELVGAIGPFLGAEIIRKNQEEELRLFFRNAPEILAIANPNGYFSKVNPAFVEALGYTETELTSQPIMQFVHPDDVAPTKDEYGLNISGERLADNFINRYQTKEGEYKWFSWKSSKPFGKDGQFFAYGRDITKQKLAENDLQNRTRQLNAIASINSRLINFENWYQVINESFAEIAEVVQVDRVYYFKNGVQQTTGQEVTSQILEWTRENVKPQIDNPTLQEVPVEMIAEFFEPMRKNEPYQGHSKNVKDTALREILFDQDIKSILCLPILVQKKIWGFIGFDDCTRERIWTPDEIVFLRTIATNLATAIESHETELKLKEAHDERSNILESIGDAFFAVDKNWVVTYWNQEAEKVTGKSKDEMLGKILWDQYEDAKSLKFFPEYHRAMNTGQIVNFEEYYPVTNSWYEVSVYPSDKGLSVYFKDVSIRKNAEEQIRQSSERFEKVTEATNDAIWDFDVTNNALFWGKGFETLFGYNSEETKPTFEFLISLIHPEDRDRIVNKITQFLADSDATNWFEEYRFKKSDNQFAYIVDRAIFIRNAQGRTIRVVGAMTDITHRKEHEESLKELNEQLEKHARDLERSNAELEQFAYIASHDLQEPLRMVTSFLNQLELKYNDQLDEKAQQYIYFAVDGARRMRQIILDLLEYSRAGREEEDLTSFDLNELIDGYRVLRKTAIEESSATIKAHHLPTINGYKTPVTQVFHNLIDNGLKYAREGVAPQIEINATDKGHFWEFSVCDNGIGIDKEYFDKVFIIFQRLHDKSEYNGTGMGLAIVKKIIDNLGGKIWLESTPNSGSCFYFTLSKHF